MKRQERKDDKAKQTRQTRQDYYIKQMLTTK
jgi:hypothetical protein